MLKFCILQIKLYYQFSTIHIDLKKSVFVLAHHKPSMRPRPWGLCLAYRDISI